LAERLVHSAKVYNAFFFLHAIDLKEKSQRKNSSRLILWAAQWCDLSFASHHCHDAVCAKEINKGYTHENQPLW